MFTESTAPNASHVFTLAGTGLGAFCIFQTFGFIVLGRKLAKYAMNLQGQRVEKIRKTDVLSSLWRGVLISMWGLGCSLLGL